MRPFRRYSLATRVMWWIERRLDSLSVSAQGKRVELQMRDWTEDQSLPDVWYRDSCDQVTWNKAFVRDECT